MASVEKDDDFVGTAIGDIAGQAGDFVLVCGDLTKDGEIICHNGDGKAFKQAESPWKKGFCCPGKP